MRRRIISILLLVSICFIPVYWNVFASNEAISLKNHPSIEMLELTSELPSQDLLGRLILLPQSDFAIDEAFYMIQNVSLVPEPVLRTLVRQNVQLYLFDGLLTDVEGFEHLRGSQPRGYTSNGPTWDNVPGIGGSKLVLAKIGHSHPGNGHSSINLELHELAHSIDRFVYGNIRYNEMFQTIWKEEAPILFPNQNYFLHFIEEYFAETFAMYFLNDATREKLQLHAPKTYSFFETLDHLPAHTEFTFKRSLLY
ncbi:MULTISPECIES: anthrax toxin lethal factor-related metalloendopeptidase [Bacillus]|uniref:anthrax toxin lethal factor-related metalloendopeptidase n=1 Tax=Bacillus TaxID=1386 RepID=UPI000BB76384|nr:MULTISPECIES: toxin [Bacillus]